MRRLRTYIADKGGPPGESYLLLCDLCICDGTGADEDGDDEITIVYLLEFQWGNTFMFKKRLTYYAGRFYHIQDMYYYDDSRVWSTGRYKHDFKEEVEYIDGYVKRGQLAYKVSPV